MASSFTEPAPKFDEKDLSSTGGDSTRAHTPVENVAPLEKVSTAPSAAAELEYVSGIKLFVVLLAVTLTCFLIMLDLSIIVTAIPRITSDFHSLTDVGWYGAAYLLASCSLQPTTGKIYTYFNSKWSYLTFFGIFEIGSLICGVAPSSTVLIVGRAIAGMGSSGLMNGSLTILSACLPLQKRPLYMGLMMSIAQFGVLLGPLIGGALTEYTTWRWCFYINLPVGAPVALFLVLINIPDRTVKTDERLIPLIRKRLDLVGFLLFAPAIIQLLLALEWGGVKYPWESANIIGLFCGGAANILLFLYWEWRAGDDAMVPFSMMRKRIVWSSSMNMFFFMGSMLILTYYLPIYFQAVRGASPLLSGVYILPSIISQMIGAVLSGVLTGKIGYYLPFIVISGVLTAIAQGLLSTLGIDSSTGVWIGFQILGGFGRGLGFQMSIIAIQNVLPQAQTATAMAILMFFQIFGGALILAVTQTLFSAALYKAMAKLAPSVNADLVVHAGATAVRDAVNPADLPGVLLAYNRAINSAFYLAAGCSVAYFCFAWGMGWKSIKVKRPAVAEATPEAAVEV